MPRRPSHLRGLSLVELLVAVAILGVLTSLALPGVQASRESARRAICTNHLRSQILAVLSTVSVRGEFPAGRKAREGRETSWCLEVLPHLEHVALYDQFDRTKPWRDPGANLAIADASLEVFVCPSSQLGAGPGRTDYTGISGSLMHGVWKRGSGLFNGVMVENSPRRPLRVGPADVTDGASHTIALAECSDRPLESGGRWIAGSNAISQDNGGVAAQSGGEIFGQHSDCAAIAYVDGHVTFVASTVSPTLLGALCTRSGEEIQSRE